MSENCVSLTEKEGLSLESWCLPLVQRLQSTLEINNLMEIFNEEVSRHIPHDGLEYNHPAGKLQIAIGKKRRFSYGYQLILLEESLGEITFSRSTAISTQEANRLETLLCALLHPLRNCIFYKRAIETAFKDPVTAINNRASMDATLQRDLDLARRHKAPLSLIMVDIDKFKSVNDTYGHIVGDAVLRDVAGCITESTRKSDCVFRFGGEEFSIVLSNTGLGGAKLLAERVRLAVAKQKFRYDELVIQVTVSLGLTCYQEGDVLKSLVERADKALYEAKLRGRNRVVTDPESV
jgi:diguanylate cyclase (GGDEF)-like protein